MMMVFFIHSFKKKEEENVEFFYFSLFSNEDGWACARKKGRSYSSRAFLYFLKGKRRRGGRGSKRKRIMEAGRQTGEPLVAIF
jgi:hypothetical protein